MMFLKRLFPAILVVLVGAVPLRAAPLVTIELPAGTVIAGNSFSLTVRATGPIETFLFLLDLPASLVTPPNRMTLSAYPTAGGLPSEAETLDLDEVVAFGFHLAAVAQDYEVYLPLVPVGTGRVLGIIPQPPLANDESEVTFTGSFIASTPGTALFRLGYVGTLSGVADTFSGTLDRSLVILRAQTPGDGSGGGPGDGPGGGPGGGPVPVPAPPALALFLVALAGLAVHSRSAA
jgi:hypothetical protein